ncbi:hypothetical protein CEXT_187591 [Caerostris extrusa]|uniref:Uncharacterized protein n=1 Tax=Caerostris extrusa TaxID=172846 RepID=A0AAV4WZ06_CAEEX|nr:hypothetical protein CEXT_187591 [Caerostris extrusa]
MGLFSTNPAPNLSHVHSPPFDILLRTICCGRIKCPCFSGKMQNQSLRIVSGAVKSTPIYATLMLTGDKLLRTVIQEKTLILWGKIIRVPGCFSLWNEVKQDLTRNLKTQMDFQQGVLQLKIHLV